MAGSSRRILELITVQLWLVSEIPASGSGTEQKKLQMRGTQDLKQGNKDWAEHILFLLTLFYWGQYIPSELQLRNMKYIMISCYKYGSEVRKK